MISAGRVLLTVAEDMGAPDGMTIRTELRQPHPDPPRSCLALGRVQAGHFLGERVRRYGFVAVAQGPGFARAHLDPLRIGGVVAAGVLLLFFTSWTWLLWIALFLVLYELLVGAVAATGHERTGDSPRSAKGESAHRGDTVSTA